MNESEIQREDNQINKSTSCQKQYSNNQQIQNYKSYQCKYQHNIESEDNQSTRNPEKNNLIKHKNITIHTGKNKLIYLQTPFLITPSVFEQKSKTNSELYQKNNKMKKKASRTSSQIVTAFVEANQQLQMREEISHLDQLAIDLKSRRNRLQSKLLDKPNKEHKVLDASKSEQFKSMDDHRIELSTLEARLETDYIKGLTTVQAEQKLLDFGKNQLSEKKKTPWYVQLLHEYFGFFGILQMTGGALCFLAYGLSPDPSTLYLGIVLFLVNIMTGSVTFLQNAKSEAIMEAFKNFIPSLTSVIRDGQDKRSIPATDLVKGDIVIIELGKWIPADLRILESNNMKVDNSSLTGESLLMLRSVECTNKENPLETKNLAFFGTLCKEGSGKGVVINTGDKTVIGQIANLAASAEGGLTPIRKELNRFVQMVATIAIIVGTFFFIFGFVIGYDAITNLIFAVGIIVGFVPNGLLATVTIALSLTAKKLAQKKVLVKNLEGVETLGSTSCICSDKTGTLTQNKMSVEHLWINGMKLKGANRQKMGDKHPYQYKLDDIGFQQLQECAMLCSEAVFDEALPQDKTMKIQNDETFTQAMKEKKLQEATELWKKNLVNVQWLDRPTSGDASESALIKFFQPIEKIETTRARYQTALDFENKLCRMPFNSTNKYAFLILEYPTEDSHYCLMSKGAPEKIWDLCENIYINGKTEKRTLDWSEEFEQINRSFGGQGERVLGFAKHHLPKNKFPKGFNFNIYQMNFPFNEQTFIGLISLVDPPKDSVPYAVIRCKTAGIQVIMVTGDQPVTATAIARQCNIVMDKTANELAEEMNITFEEACKLSNAVVIHGDRLTKMAIDDEGLPESEKGRALQAWVSKPQVVFARTSPAQKLIIVSACQKMGHIVAVTGDGVNDSPAIKKADIGVAMGIAGSDVAKDAADMILLDDDFSSIVIGIEEGRKLFDNLKKVACFLLISTICEAWPFLALMIIQVPLPLSTVLILLIDLGSNLVPSTALVYEEAEVDIMTRDPRRQDAHLVTANMVMYAYIQFGTIQTSSGFFCWFITMNDFGIPSSSTFFLNGITGQIPQNNDYYDPYSPYLGNSNLKIKYEANGGKCLPSDMNDFVMIDWLYAQHSIYDLRQTLVKCGSDGNWKENVVWGSCNVNQISPITQRPICWTTEANKYAVTSHYFGLVVTQYSCYFSVQTLKLSVLYQGVSNFFLFFGFYVNFWILACFAYFEGINIAFGTRDVIFQHYGICAIPFGIYIVVWAEIRKFMIRNYPPQKPGMPNWWTICTGM